MIKIFINRYGQEPIIIPVLDRDEAEAIQIDAASQNMLCWIIETKDEEERSD